MMDAFLWIMFFFLIFQLFLPLSLSFTVKPVVEKVTKLRLAMDDFETLEIIGRGAFGEVKVSERERRGKEGGEKKKSDGREGGGGGREGWWVEGVCTYVCGEGRGGEEKRGLVEGGMKEVGEEWWL